MRPTKKDFDRVDRKVMSDVLEFGWSDIAVFPVPDHPGLPFNYSVGFTERKHPEMLVMGFDNEQMHMVLASAWAEIKNGVVFEPNTLTDLILVEFDVAILKVDNLHHEDYMMSIANRIYGDEATGLQIVWPDTHGRFPWHDDFEEQFRDRQILASAWKGPT